MESKKTLRNFNKNGLNVLIYLKSIVWYTKPKQYTICNITKKMVIICQLISLFFTKLNANFKVCYCEIFFI